MRYRLIRTFLLTAAVLVGGCDDASIIDTGAGTDPGTTPGPGGTPTTPVLRLGSFSGSTFTAGTIAISPTTSTSSPLGAGSSVSMTVSIVDTANSNALVTDSVAVSFNSTCISQGDSTLGSNPVTSTTGTVIANYTYTGASCGSPDVITATAIAGSQSLTATGSIVVTPSPATSLLFTSATPTSIGLNGSGEVDTSTLVFRVTNTAGGVVEGQIVNFTLDTTVGGITLTPSSGTTDASGEIRTVVRSGTVPTSVRVTGRLVDTAATPFDESTVTPASGSLVISTSLADQDSFSLSIGCFNIEGDTIDGTQTSVNIRASDRFNNPVRDGTAVSFTAEGGSITPSCLTSGGACSVQFTSQNPRTADHRVTVLATAIGEESFTDLNGNGRFDGGVDTLIQDLAEAFRDDDEDTARDTNEPFLDFNNSGGFNSASGFFTGGLCNSGCDPDPDGTGPLTAPSSLHARANSVIIMSGSTASINIVPNAIDLSGGPVAVLVEVGDNEDQPMPGGTTIAASTTFGTISGAASRTQACTTFNGPFPYAFVVEPPGGATSGAGSFTITVTSPSGIVSTRSAGVSFSASPPPPPPPAGALGSMRFVAATPTTIGIRGSGLEETSTVQFQVLSDTGVPMADQVVSFSLNTTVGGIAQTPSGTGATATTAISDSQGFVSTIVRAGTVHTSVRVTATATAGAITVSAVSEQLVITTGLPDQDSFSLSLTCANVESLNLDNVEVDVNLLAADRFNNPVADGTAVALTTEGGAVVGACLTDGGACSVKWRSQDPRPIAFNGCTSAIPGYAGPDFTALGAPLCANGPRAGRSTILATAIGEESFNDINGDGRRGTGETFGDLTEAFRDDDGDDLRDNPHTSPNTLSDEFLDFNDNGTFTGANSLFNGGLCDANCDTASPRLHVRDSVLVIMSGSSPSLLDTEPFADTNLNGVRDGAETFTDLNNNGIYDTHDISVSSNVSYNPGSNTFTIPEQSFGVLSFVVRDVNDQPMPRGTVVSVSATGEAGAFIGTTSFTKPCTADDTAAGNTQSFSFLTPDVTATKVGAIELKVATPSGLATIFGFGVRATVAKCDDGVDNDGDGFVDFDGVDNDPATNADDDPQCASANDDDEAL